MQRSIVRGIAGVLLLAIGVGLCVEAAWGVAGGVGMFLFGGLAVGQCLRG